MLDERIKPSTYVTYEPRVYTPDDNGDYAWYSRRGWYPTPEAAWEGLAKLRDEYLKNPSNFFKSPIFTVVRVTVTVEPIEEGEK